MNPLVAFLVAQGNHALRCKTVVPLDRLDHRVFSGTPAERGLHLWPPGAETPVSFDQWLERHRPERLLAVKKSRRVPEPGAVAVGSNITPRFMLAGFADHPGLLLAAERDGAYEMFEGILSFPPRTHLGLDDLVGFVGGRPESEVIKEHVLWWNEHNLHWTKGNDWADFLASVTDENCVRLIEDFSMIMSNSAFSSATRKAWRTLVEEHENPDFGALYDFYYRETLGSLPPDDGVGAMRTELRAALDDIIAFAKKEGLGRWPDYFARARAMLEAPVSDPVTIELFGDCDLPRPAMQLLAATLNADAFGGMGSWNDQSPEDSAGFQRCSQALHRCLLPSIEAAVDATAEAGRGEEA